uniref:YprB ribonuclease H-like domain-containing protein n=1 Tax=uncultured organism TaxID=155900 RepID=A0A7L9QBS4_9ZZZZ|nr:hypothetical protein [uncultured organism]
MTDAPRILTLDIETSPNIVYRWGLYDDGPVALNQLIEPQRVISCAFKWYGKPRVLFHSEYHDGHAAFIERTYEIMNQADILIHYNGTTFDMPHLRTEFALAGMTPNAPAQEIDLYQVVKRRFRFPSSKLDYVAQRLGVGGKVSHAGQALWTACLAGDPAAWRTMRRYNMNDVVITEGVYDKVRAWIKNPPNMGLWQPGDHVCPNCGSADLMRNGTRSAGLSTYQRYQCRGCGAYSRSGKAIDRAVMRAAS